MTIKSYKINDLSPECIAVFNSTEVDFFSSIPWYRNWLENVLDKELGSESFFVFEKDQALQFILPLKVSVSDFGCRLLEGLSNYYSPVYQPVFADNSCDLQFFFHQLKGKIPAWDTLTLNAMPKEQVFSLLPVLKEAGLPGIPFYCFANWYLEVNQRSFDQYFSTLSSRLKNTVTRKTRQFNKLEGARLEVVTTAQQLDKAIDAFQLIYTLSWKEEETYPEFISGLIKVAAEQGGLRLGLAYLQDKPIAAQLWIVADNTAYIYKLAYDESYKPLSVGSILTAKLMRHVIDVDKVACVDYLSGDDAYKKDWMSHRRERWGVKAFNSSTWRGCLEMMVEFSKFYLKRLRDVVLLMTDKFKMLVLLPLS